MRRIIEQFAVCEPSAGDRKKRVAGRQPSNAWPVIAGSGVVQTGTIAPWKSSSSRLVARVADGEIWRRHQTASRRSDCLSSSARSSASRRVDGQAAAPFFVLRRQTARERRGWLTCGARPAFAGAGVSSHGSPAFLPGGEAGRAFRSWKTKSMPDGVTRGAGLGRRSSAKGDAPQRRRYQFINTLRSGFVVRHYRDPPRKSYREAPA